MAATRQAREMQQEDAFVRALDDIHDAMQAEALRPCDTTKDKNALVARSLTDFLKQV